MNIMGVLPQQMPALPSLPSLPTVALLCVATVQTVLAMIRFATAGTAMANSILTFVSGLTHDYLSGLSYSIVYLKNPLKKVHLLQLILGCLFAFVLNCIILSQSPISDLTEISRNLSEISTGAVSFVILCAYIIVATFLSAIYMNRPGVDPLLDADSVPLLQPIP